MRSLLLTTLIASLGGCALFPGQPDRADLLTIATWNVEHLAERNDSGCRPRQDPDYAALAAHVAAVRPEIVALQEVESEAAAYRVFDPQDYVVVLEERPGGGPRAECRGLAGLYLNRQAVGFAIRRDVMFVRHPDLAELSLDDPNLRSGVDITVNPVGAEPIRLLAVHLKSGCSSGDRSEACDTLFRQVPVVERWIDARASAGESFAVLGDFNRRLATPGDAVWSEWDDGAPLGADLTLASGAEQAGCDPRYPAFIDHIVLGARAGGRLIRFEEITYSGEGLSDHCLVLAELDAS
ncbi:endonuclease/exonuclease/phosphatase family protein [Brevundimonas sp.]|uniref:endonuclease/exonuclease/phosphatase family protein n=1 Tax=Brevundimonas sp. TaxID=1871086 RepID=UPI0025EE5562|nr:endonuclease/exonuclease/phosphatase family protein [Brevundimonas sp.]